MHLFSTPLLALLLCPWLPARALPGEGPAPDAQPWWVLFADRGPEWAADSRALLEMQQAGLEPRTLARRLQRGSLGAVGEWDLPPSASYISTVLATGAQLRQSSRWLNGVSVWATPEQREHLAALPGVRALRPVARARHTPLPALPEEEPRLPGPVVPQRLLDYGPSALQLEEIDVPRLHEAGFDGAGVVVLMLDTGYYTAHQAIPETQVLAQWDFINNDGQTANEPGDDAAPAQPRHLYPERPGGIPARAVVWAGLRGLLPAGQDRGCNQRDSRGGGQLHRGPRMGRGPGGRTWPAAAWATSTGIPPRTWTARRPPPARP
jgi:hypothetical protein